MNLLLKILFSLSISGSLLILLLFLCKPLYKNILTKKWQYYIWIVVIARLLIPIAPEFNIVGTLFQSFSIEKANTPLTSSDLDYSYSIREFSVVEEETTDIVQDTPNSFHFASPALFSISTVLSFFTENLFFIWLLVVLILFIRKITIYQNFHSYIKAGCVEISDVSLLNRFFELEDASGVKRMIELYTNELISSPLLIGFIHPCIVLPSTDISSTDFDYTILHELTHYKQMDLFYKWLIQLTVCLHWFNPLVYLMAREINHACELSCDEAVIQDLDADGMQAYGDTLLHAIKIKGGYKSCVASITLTEGKELLMERLASIMDFKKPTRKLSIIAILCTIFIIFSSAVAGAYPISIDSSMLMTVDNIFSENFTDDSSILVTVDNISSENFTATEKPETVDFLLPEKSMTYDISLSSKANIDCIYFTDIPDYSSYEPILIHSLEKHSHAELGTATLFGGNTYTIDADWENTNFITLILLDNSNNITQKYILSNHMLYDIFIPEYSQYTFIIQNNSSKTLMDFSLYLLCKETEAIIADTITESASNNKIDYNQKGIEIIESSGTWEESFEELLPFMSPDAIEKAVNIYLDKHLFYRITSHSEALNVEYTISSAYPYMKQEAIQKIKDRIKIYSA